MKQTLTTDLVFDPLLIEAANRAFHDLADRRDTLDPSLMADRISELGFDQALADPLAGDAWPDAACILRAQARAALPFDMAAWLVLGDRRLASASRAEAYRVQRPGWLGEAAPALVRPGMTLARCLQISAAIESAIDLAIRYVQDRQQFGRPLARFQAVQQQLAVAAEESAACTTVTDFALAAVHRHGLLDERVRPLLMAAALVTAGAVPVCTDATHQVHGAMGFTREYPLHRYSLDMMHWRDELLYAQHGDMRCAETLGTMAIAAGGLWPFITDTMQT